VRIAHFTDIHITAPPFRISWKDLFSKRFLGWVNLTLGRSSAFSDAGTVVEALVRDLEALKPDHIVSTGDLTGLSLPAEFEAAGKALAPLFDSTALTSIPGNHDVYVRSAVRRKLYEGAFGKWTRTALALEDFPEELRQCYPYPLVELLGEDAALLSLLDVRPNALHDSSGLVGERQVRMLERLLVDPKIASRTKVLALHTGVCLSDRRPDKRFHGLRDARSVLETARKGKVSLIIHGHIHRRFVIPADPEYPFAIANPGSLTSRRHDRTYHLFELSGGQVTLSARRYDDETKAFVPWPDAPGTGVIAGAG
jgi:3',5'-cyclic AMP phosphodiesterase CpdA